MGGTGMLLLIMAAVGIFVVIPVRQGTDRAKREIKKMIKQRSA